MNNADRVRRWREKNKDNPECSLGRNKRRKYQRKQVENLSNWYIRFLIRKGSLLKNKDIPKCVVDLYRLNLILRREKRIIYGKYKDSK